MDLRRAESAAQPPIAFDTALRSGALHYSWYVVVVLMVGYALSFIDRQILGLLVAPIKHDLAISDTKIGLLQGLAFGLFYSVVGLPIGRLVDVTNRRNLIAVGVLFWSFFTSLCGAAKVFWTLFLCRFGVGVGEASLSPAAFSTIADYFPRQRLGLALSVYSCGVLLGSAVALSGGGTVVDLLSKTPFMTLPVLGTVASWRVTFLIVGLPGFLFPLLLWTVREPVRKNLLTLADRREASLTVRG